MLGKDFVYAARTLRKSPVFLITATVTIALGVGASTAIFSVANAVLLRPLPYQDPDRLVLICSDMRTRNVVDTPVSNENYMDLHDGARKMFEDIGAVGTTFRFSTPREDGTLEQVSGANVTTNFFSLIGARIAVGRDFQPDDGQPQPPPDPAAGPVGAVAGATPALPIMAIISNQYWQRRYGSNANVVGHEILNLGVNRAQIVGVLAPDFQLLFRPAANMEPHPDIFIALRRGYDNRNRNTFFLRPVGRLRASVSLDRAQEEVNLVADEIRRNFPIYGTGGFHYRLESMHKYLVAEVRPAILALMGAVIFLLLIACANVANLILVKASLRERELAVRAALGGSRSRLVRQMLAEALLLSALGTILGVILAKFGILELIAIGPADLPRIDSITLDPYVLGFTVLAGVLAAAVFGVVPALRASRPDVMNVLRGSSRTAGLGSSGPRGAVVVVEVALCFVLLIGSGLMFRSFLELQHVKLGYESHGLLTLQILNNQRLASPEQRAASVRDLQRRLSSIPGVESVTASNLVPLGGGFSPIRWGKEHALADPSKYQAVDSQIVLPGFFETLQTPLLDGRTFTEADNDPKRNVAVIDQLLAAKAFPNQSAVGKRLLIRIRTPEPEWVEIIGVVNHQLTTSLVDPGREQIYFTDGFLQHGNMGRWEIRTAGDPARYAALVRAEIAKLGSQLGVTQVQPLDALVIRAQGGTRFSLLLIATFACIAALLATVGLYGVLSTLVRQRTAEIGARMALGAAPRSIFQLIVGHGLRLSATGIALGVLAALGLTRAMTSMLVGIKPTDPATFGAMIVFFFVIATAACWIPARRAAGLAPTTALRDE
ncbi:MAG TPA: ABC transporter permease [Bryobacteraceae bacterium]|nr:ABC transporter permease [Bryobacteraceae bacterium]